MDEEYIMIPKSEYEFLLSCKQELIEIHENAILKAKQEMEIMSAQSIINKNLVPK